MKNSPNTSPRSLSPYQRLSILAVLGTIGTCSPLNDAEAKNPIPYCKDLSGHRNPGSKAWLDGKEKAEMICVVDGDTFDVKLADTGEMIRIRIWGADCPESSRNRKCRSKGERECSEEVKEGKIVANKVRSILTKKVSLEPPYKNNGDRKLAYIKLANGVDLGRKLISSCLCSAPEKYKHKRKDDYRRAGSRCNK